MTKRIAIVCPYPIPEGMAATTRIMAYSKGIVQNGVGVDVFSFIPSGSRLSSYHDNQGYFNEIFYCYPFRRKRFNNKLFHGLEIFYSIFKTYNRIKADNITNNYDALIISSDNPFIILLYAKLSYVIGVKSIFIFDEYPTPIRKYLKNDIPLWKKFSYSICLSKVDAYISMTHKLASFYLNIKVKPLLLVSSVIDVDRFALTTSLDYLNKSKRRICYMGNMELSKDNVDNIILAFSYIASDFIDVDLYLYGKPNLKDKMFLDSLINELGIVDRVHFGYVGYNDVPSILKSSHILVSSQPNTKRAEGGFPTKLGEYLASGVPVLLTNVGGISDYVSDRNDVFFAKSEDPTDFSLKLLYILNNYEFAKEVGSRGKRLVYANYSCSTVGKKILDFINDLK